MMQVDRIVIFTDAYPFGKGEKSFVAPEIEYLNSKYRIVLVSTAPDNYLLDDDSTCNIPGGVELIHYPRNKYKPYRALQLLSFFFSCIGHVELKKIWRSKIRKAGRILSSALMYSNARSLQRFLQKEGLFEDTESTIYYTFWFNFSTLAISMQKRSNDFRLISRLHGYDLFNERNRFGRQPFTEEKKDACSKLLFACDAGLKYFERVFGDPVAPGQYSVCCLGCSKGELIDHKDDEVFRIVSCSNVIPLKRVNLIAQGLSLLHEYEIEWTHFGDGPDSEKVAQLSKLGNVNVTFVGHVSNDQVVKHYRNHRVDAFITASSTEGCPVSIQEALSFGVPIIGTAVGGIPDQIDGNGVLLDADPSAEEIARAVLLLYEAAPDEMERMRHRSFQIWQEKYDRQKNLRTLSKIISTLQLG